MLVPEQIQIFLCAEPIDMRKGANGLAGIVRDALMEEPLSRKLFVFQSKRADRCAFDGLRMDRRSVSLATYLVVTEGDGKVGRITSHNDFYVSTCN